MLHFADILKPSAETPRRLLPDVAFRGYPQTLRGDSSRMLHFADIRKPSAKCFSRRVKRLLPRRVTDILSEGGPLVGRLLAFCMKSNFLLL
jgi:hypothetical protein